MPSLTTAHAKELLETLESHWVSLLLWVADQSGVTPDELIAPLGYSAARASENLAKEVAKQGGKTDRFTVIHFLDFGSYAEAANVNRKYLEPLGNPPVGWASILDQQRSAGVVRYRNHLAHGNRFNMLSLSERRNATDLLAKQLANLREWWPACPVQPQIVPSEDDPIRGALRLLGPDPKDAVPLVRELGLNAISNALDLIPSGDPSDLAGALAGTASRLYRIGEIEASPSRAALFLVYLNQLPERSAQRERVRRKVARALIEHQQSHPRWIAILLSDNGDPSEVEFVLPRTRPDERPKREGIGTVRATITPQDPTRYHVDLLRELKIEPPMTLFELTKRWNRAFSVERVTNDFYREFHDLRNRLIDALLVSNPDNPALAGKDPKSDPAFELKLNAFATRQLSRLLFLWFLQQKGWLGGDPVHASSNYLIERFLERPAGGHTYFYDVLIPIFFDGLGRHIDDDRHIDVAARFGQVPYLDGGLFRPEADPFEAELFDVRNGIPTRRVILPDDLFDPSKDRLFATRRKAVRSRTVLGLLGGYRFTTQESTPDDQSVDPDPELLGKVFENLYQEDDRHQTGAYYTPREIVHYMCRQTLDGYLRDRTGISQAIIENLRKEALDWTVRTEPLTDVESSAMQRALSNVTVLDPAVGSGAFLVAMLQEIVLLKRGVWQNEHNREMNRSSDDIARWKFDAITKSLYGVDINPMATEICRLRLWLSLVIEREVDSLSEIHALPNLDFRIVAGDSLVDRMGSIPFEESLTHRTGSTFEGGTHTVFQTGLVSAALKRDIALWKREFEEAGERGDEESLAVMRDRSAKIRNAQVTIAQDQLDGAIEAVKGNQAKLAMNGKATKGTIARVASQLASLEELRRNLRPDAPFQKPLLWPVVFQEVVGDRIGFDIVVANPPYVQQEDLDPFDQTAHQHAFPEISSGTTDLYVAFYGRAMQLLRDGGWLAFITSNKYMRGGYGAGLRQYLPANLQVLQVIDFGDLPLFDVAAYPAVVVGCKTNQPDPDATVQIADLVYPIRKSLRDIAQSANTTNVRTALEDLEQHIVEAHAPNFPQIHLRRDGWILADPRIVRLVDRLMSVGTPFHSWAKGRVYRGLTTGLNEAFVIDETTRHQLISQDARSEERVKPWLRGRDLERWTGMKSGLYCIAIQNSGDSDANNAWGDAVGEPEARRIFYEAYPAIHDHLTKYEARLRPRADQGRYWWELRACAYYSEFDRPKVIWKKTAFRPAFAFDQSGSFLTNTVHFVPDAEPWLAAIMNSTIMEFMMVLKINLLRGGYIELTPTRLAPFPVPNLDSSMKGHLNDLALNIDLGGSNSEQQIDEVVTAAYGIEDGDLEVISRYLAPRRTFGPSDDAPRDAE